LARLVGLKKDRVTPNTSIAHDVFSQ